MITEERERMVPAAPASKSTGSTDRRQAGGGRRWRFTVLAVVAVALGLRLLTAGHGILTTDEPSWLRRSADFETALFEFDFDQATAAVDKPATRPGITTMWIGSAARMTIRSLDSVGLVDAPVEDSQTVPLTLRLSQIYMAGAVAALIGWAMALARPVIGTRPAVIFGFLLAVEPYFIGHSSVLHTDALVAITVVGSILAVMGALRLGVGGDPSAPPRRPSAVAGGLLFALAVLTKLNGLLAAPAFAVFAIVAYRRRVRAGPEGGSSAVGSLLLPVFAIVTATSALLFVAIYPAFWVAPVRELRGLVAAGSLADVGHAQFFMGRATNDPGFAFYPVVLAFRTSPWLLAGTLGAIVFALARRVPRYLVATIVLSALPYLVAVSLSSKKIDRYALPVLPILALLAGISGDWIWRRHLRPRLPKVRHVRGGVGAGLAVTLAMPAVALSPHTLAFYNPLLVRGSLVEDTLLVGWGEGIEQFGEYVAREEAGRCREVVVGTNLRNRIPFPCGQLGSLRVEEPDTLDLYDYVVYYPQHVQRFPSAAEYRAALERRGTVVMDLHLGGVDYGRLYRINGGRGR